MVVLEERGGEGFPFLEGEDDCFGGRGGIFFFFWEGDECWFWWGMQFYHFVKAALDRRQV